MPFPHTLFGTIGFIIFLVFVVAMMVPDANNVQALDIKQKQLVFQDTLNQSINTSSTASPGASIGLFGFFGIAAGLEGIYDFIVGTFQVVWSFVSLLISYLTAVLTVFIQIPVEFYLIFILLSIGLIISIIKLVFLSGD